MHRKVKLSEDSKMFLDSFSEVIQGDKEYRLVNLLNYLCERVDEQSEVIGFLSDQIESLRRDIRLHESPPEGWMGS